MAGITVRFDGSCGAQRALGWAMREAVIWHIPLTVLTVHCVAANGWTGYPIVLPADEQPVERARRRAAEAIAKSAADLGEPIPAESACTPSAGGPDKS